MDPPFSPSATQEPLLDGGSPPNNMPQQQQHAGPRRNSTAFDPPPHLQMLDAVLMLDWKCNPCPQRYHHDWSICPNYHNNDKCKRRSLRQFNYSSTMCPEFERCPRGDLCHMSHSLYEMYLHPERYKTEMCRRAVCDRKVCFFAHSRDQLRTPMLGLTARDHNNNNSNSSGSGGGGGGGGGGVRPLLYNTNNTAAGGGGAGAAGGGGAAAAAAARGPQGPDPSGTSATAAVAVTTPTATPKAPATPTAEQAADKSEVPQATTKVLVLQAPQLIRVPSEPSAASGSGRGASAAAGGAAAGGAGGDAEGGGSTPQHGVVATSSTASASTPGAAAASGYPSSTLGGMMSSTSTPTAQPGETQNQPQTQPQMPPGSSSSTQPRPTYAPAHNRGRRGGAQFAQNSSSPAFGNSSNKYGMQGANRPPAAAAAAAGDRQQQSTPHWQLHSMQQAQGPQPLVLPAHSAAAAPAGAPPPTLLAPDVLQRMVTSLAVDPTQPAAGLIIYTVQHQLQLWQQAKMQGAVLPALHTSAAPPAAAHAYPAHSMLQGFAQQQQQQQVFFDPMFGVQAAPRVLQMPQQQHTFHNQQQQHNMGVGGFVSSAANNHNHNQLPQHSIVRVPGGVSTGYLQEAHETPTPQGVACMLPGGGGRAVAGQGRVVVQGAVSGGGGGGGGGQAQQPRGGGMHMHMYSVPVSSAQPQAAAAASVAEQFPPGIMYQLVAGAAGGDGAGDVSSGGGFVGSSMVGPQQQMQMQFPQQQMQQQVVLVPLQMGVRAAMLMQQQHQQQGGMYHMQ